MARTILPKKAYAEIPIATDDEALTQLIRDPAISQFPQTSTVDNYYSTVSNPINGFSQRGDTQQYLPQQQSYVDPAEYNAASNAEVLVKHNKESADWINRRWRPAMGWMYMVVCIFDFILFPIMFTIVQFWETQAANDAFRQWQPVTLMGAGLFHMAMGAVLGIAAYGRTKEKLEGATKN